jgi:putative PIN family toxin of toxin-antitoxin system
VILDTNCVLDLWVFDDPSARPLRAALEGGALRWLATSAMRDELARVLGYPQIVHHLTSSGSTAKRVLVAFDAHAELMPPAALASVRCRDLDDQPFIDLAVAWRATLISKDARVLSLAQRLALLGVEVRQFWKDGGRMPIPSA